MMGRIPSSNTPGPKCSRLGPFNLFVLIFDTLRREIQYTNLTFNLKPTDSEVESHTGIPFFSFVFFFLLACIIRKKKWEIDILNSLNIS